MAVMRMSFLERLCPLVDLQLHQISLKEFEYHETASFPYNLLITVLEDHGSHRDYFLTCWNNAKVRLRSKHTYLLPCNLPIRFERTSDFVVVTMRFNLTVFYGIDIFNGCKDIREIYDLAFAEQLRQLANTDEGGAIQSIVALKAEVMKICLACWPEDFQELRPALWKYEKVFRYVREHCDARLTVGALAAIYGLRQDVFSRAFRRDIGIPPKTYISDCLLKKISLYLLSAQLNIKEIAYELNFSSEYYMSRFFKKGTTYSPSDYRKRFSAGANT